MRERRILSPSLGSDIGTYKLFDLGDYVKRLEVERCVRRERKDVYGKVGDFWMNGLKVYYDCHNFLLTLPAEIRILSTTGEEDFLFNVVVGDFYVYRSEELQEPLYRLARFYDRRLQDYSICEMQAKYEAEKRRKESKW